MTQVNYYGFNQLSQSLHFRKGQYDPNSQSVRDESFNNGDSRDVQDGRYYKGDGVGALVDLRSLPNFGFKSQVSIGHWFKYIGSNDYQLSFITDSTSSGGGNDNRTVLSLTPSSVFGKEGQIYIFTESNRDLFGYYTNNGFDDGKWHHLVWVLDKPDYYVYVDGVLEDVTERAINVPSEPPEANLNFSSSGALLGFFTTDNFFNGYIQQVFVYDGVLSQSEVNKVKDHDFDISSMLTYWKFDEGGGTTAFDSSGNGYHGTINNANLSTFHASGDDAPYSFQNNTGYTYDSVNDRYIPRDENNTDKDVQGNSLQYSGKVPYDLIAKDSNCGKWSGIGEIVDTNQRYDFVHQTGVFNIKSYFSINDISVFQKLYKNLDSFTNGFQILYRPNNQQLSFSFVTNGNSNNIFSGSNSILKNTVYKLEVIGDGTSVEMYLDGVLKASTNITPNPNNIADQVFQMGTDGYDGLIINVKLTNPNNSADNANYVFSMGNDNFVYDVSGNGYHGEIKNASLTDFWSERQDQFHYNIENGFDLWLDGSGNKLYVPFDENGNSIKTQGDTVSGFSWDSKHEPSTNFHNGAETRFDTNAEDPHFGDFKGAVSDTGLHPSNNVSGDDRYYIRKLPDDEADRFTLYLKDQVDPQKLKTQLFTQ